MLSVKNLTFSYINSETGQPEAPVLRDFSLELAQGEAVAVMGESGSGKTTLTRLLLGLEKPVSGTIQGLEGKRVAAVFQEDRLLPWFSARKNVAAVLTCGREEAAALTDRVLEEVELSEAADKPIRELSGGMQRRAAIARALAFGGDLLILDEPLKGLDDELKKRVASRIKAHFSTLLLITHSEEEAELFGCGRIVRL